MENRQGIKTRRRKKRKQQQTTVVLIIAGVALLMAAVLMMPMIRNSLTTVGAFSKPELKSRPLADANKAGIPDAPVTIEIFSDFGCGHCANYALNTGNLIFEKYVAMGQVYIIYNSVGSLLGHPNSISTIEAAYCAGDQNMFWQFHDLIYANQVNLFANVNQKIDKTLVAFAEYLSMDIDTFNECIDSNKYSDEISEDFSEAVQAGVNSTPSFIINGKKYVGNIPIEDFDAAIEAAFAQGKK
jgi:protein-disulfide isomerase